MALRANRCVALAGTIAATMTVVTGCTFGPGVVVSTTTSTSTTTTVAPTTSTTTPPTTTTSTTTSTTSTTTTIPPTTTTTIPLVTEGASIIVANASGVTGGAALLGQELAALGFHVFDVTNAAGVEERLDVSKVYFLPAGADVAASIGRVMGGIAVARMPVPVSITGGPAALGEATVVVMLGKDVANNRPIVPG